MLRVIILTCLYFSILGVFAEEIKKEKVNVLFLIADDLNTAFTGFGHDQCQTPELDKLAKRGVLFKNMHCQYPVCGASRSSIMSGLYPYTNKASAFGSLREAMPEVVTMSQYFKNHGWLAGRISKIYHMGIPHDILKGASGPDDPLSWDLAIDIKAPEQNAAGEKTNWSPKNNTSQNFTGVIAEGDDLVHADGMAAEHAIEYLEKNKDNNFFLAVGFVRPHVPLVAPKKYFDMYKREEMIAPVVPKDDLDDVPEIIRAYKSNERDYGMTPELHKGMLQAYYASISYMDAQVGKILKKLDELGLRDNTIVVFSSDHGYLLGQHHKFQKQHLFEESTRVPFIISVPWLKSEHGKSTDKITELIDLYPTLTDLAGLTIPKILQGQTLKPLLQDVDSEQWKKDMAFTISRSGGESIKTKDFRFTQWGYGDSGYELYDLNRDPEEYKNEANNPEYAKVFDKMKNLLLAKRDNAGFDESMKIKKPKKKKKKK